MQQGVRGLCSLGYDPGNKTWGPNNPGPLHLHHNNRVMLHWICGTKEKDETPWTSLLQRIGTEDMKAVLGSRRLRWYGQVQ